MDPQTLVAMALGGRPPFAPLILEARRLASDFALPPLRPSWAIQRRLP